MRYALKSEKKAGYIRKGYLFTMRYALEGEKTIGHIPIENNVFFGMYKKMRDTY